MTEAALRAAVEGGSFTGKFGGFRVGSLHVEEHGVWLSLTTTRPDGIDTDGTVFLFARERLDDPRSVPFASGLLAALRRLLEKQPNNWAVGYLDVRMPLEVLEVGATADAYRDQFLTHAWLGRFLPERPQKPPPYVPAPAAAVSGGGALELEGLLAWIAAHAQRTYEPRWDDAMIRALPESARVLEAVHMIDSMVGGNGFEVFLAQARGAVVRQAREALEAIGAEKLAALMGAGIGLAAAQGAEFMNERAKKWLEKFEDRAAADWSEIDGHAVDRSYALLASELRPCALRYAEAHRAALVR